jgi:hypothetical protein
MLAMGRFSFLLVATVAACGGSVALPSTSSSGSGAGGARTSSATSTAPASTTSSSASTGTGGACAHCGQALTEPLTAKACPGASTTLFEAAKSCICDGACKAFCAGTSQLCGGPESPGSCVVCENDSQNGCGAAQQACLADKG